MEQNIVGYINDLFKKLIDDYGFHKKMNWTMDSRIASSIVKTISGLK